MGSSREIQECGDLQRVRRALRCDCDDPRDCCVVIASARGVRAVQRESSPPRDSFCQNYHAESVYEVCMHISTLVDGGRKR